VSTVLVVDDSELTHALVRRALGQSGLTTVHAEDSDTALQLLADNPIEAVVVDIVMPDVDGIQLIQLARSHPDVDSSVPVVFYSAHVDQEARQRIAKLQPATIVAKDGNVQDLVEAVTNLINGHASAADAPAPAAVILHIGKGLVAIRLQKLGRSVYELRRGSEVLLEAATIDDLMQDARTAGLA
jgi:DNA-binding NarL/FixJ family response regulator